MTAPIPHTPEAREPPGADALIDALYALDPEDELAVRLAGPILAAIIRELALQFPPQREPAPIARG